MSKSQTYTSIESSVFLNAKDALYHIQMLSNGLSLLVGRMDADESHLITTNLDNIFEHSSKALADLEAQS